MVPLRFLFLRERFSSRDSAVAAGAALVMSAHRYRNPLPPFIANRVAQRAISCCMQIR